MSELRLFHNWRLRNNLNVPFALQEFTQSETFLKFLINIFISESKLFVYLLSALRLSFLFCKICLLITEHKNTDNIYIRLMMYKILHKVINLHLYTKNVILTLT